MDNNGATHTRAESTTILPAWNQREKVAGWREVELTYQQLGHFGKTVQPQLLTPVHCHYKTCHVMHCKGLEQDIMASFTFNVCITRGFN